MRDFPLFFLFSITIAAKSQTTQPVPISEFIKEMMSANTEGRHTQIVMWFPTQYWKVAGDNMKANAGAIELIQEWVKDYVIIAAADGQIMEGGIIHFKSKGEMAELITVVDSSGKVYKPIEEKNLSDDILSLNGVLKPLFNNLLGAFGEGVNLFVFKLADSEGKIW